MRILRKNGHQIQFIIINILGRYLETKRYNINKKPEIIHSLYGLDSGRELRQMGYSSEEVDKAYLLRFKFLKDKKEEIKEFIVI